MRKERAIARVSDIRSESGNQNAYLTIAQWNPREHVVVPMKELPEGAIVGQRFLCFCDIGAPSADKVRPEEFSFIADFDEDDGLGFLPCSECSKNCSMNRDRINDNT